MSEKKKNLVEEALLQMENLQEAITDNAKGILHSTMKEEISELVKESLSEQEAEIEVDAGVEEIEEQAPEVKDGEIEEQGEEMIDVSDEEDEIVPDLGSIESDEIDIDIETPEGEELGVDMELPDDEGFEGEEEDALLPLDLTNASDEEILKVFKAMGEEDGIIVTKDDGDIHLKDDKTGAEYEIHTGSENNIEDDLGDDVELSEQIEDDDNEEVMYEIEIEDEAPETKEVTETEEVNVEDEIETEETPEGEVEEVSRTHASLRKVPNAKSAVKQVKDYAKSRVRPSVRESKIVRDLKEEVQQLKSKNEEYRKALNIFKDKINEVAVFNSNLAYATRLFTEHTTTKQEKINILRRFDSVETIKESKNLYKLLKEDLNGKTNSVVSEDVKSKVQKTPSNGSATNLIENKTYENPKFQRIKDLMNKINK